MGFYAEVVCPHCGLRAHVHTLLANFKLEGVLGIGGMSEVFRARDMVLGRTVAIKVLNASYREEPERINRFESECALMAKVRHENVVSVYSAGHARGQFYIAMEAVDGRSLESLVAAQKVLLPKRALEMIRQTALGLQAAHENGVLHRDVKPGNVILTPEGVVKVLDFGLSLDADEDPEKEGVIWATPYYVPPETLMRAPEDVRADIYALGMMLRNLLTGVDTLPDAGESIRSLLTAKRNLVPMREAYSKLPESLCELVDHMTTFDASERPADYKELLEEIAEVQARVGTGSLREAGQQRNRRKAKLAGLCAAAAAGTAAAVAVACLNPEMVYEQQYCTVPATLSWPEREAWLEAEQLVLQKDWRAAEAAFGKLSEGGESTTARTEAAAQELMICQLAEDDVFRTEVAARHFKAAREEESADSSAAASFDAAEAPDLPPMAAAARAVWKSDCLLSLRQTTESAAQLRAAQQRFSESGMSGLQSLAAARLGNMPRMAARAARASVRRLLQDGKFAEAKAEIERMAQSPTGLTELERSELSVQGELCEVATALYEMLRRKGRLKNAAPTAEQVRTAASSLGQGAEFTAEAYALALMVQGDYARAFAAAPRAAADSAAPFAVFMRDWKTRLGL